jgi:hypothetical protein
MLREQHLEGDAVHGAGLEMAAGHVVEIGHDEDGEWGLRHVGKDADDFVVGSGFMADDDPADAVARDDVGEIGVLAENGLALVFPALERGVLVHVAEKLPAHFRHVPQFGLQLMAGFGGAQDENAIEPDAFPQQPAHQALRQHAEAVHGDEEGAPIGCEGRRARPGEDMVEAVMVDLLQDVRARGHGEDDQAAGGDFLGDHQ